MRILAVDDEPLFLDLLRTVLVNAGYDQVETAADTDAAIALIKSAAVEFDCFLLDIRMPGKDGIELCRMIREMPAYQITPILMLTAALEEAAVDRAFDVGATDYVTKPLKGLELGARIRSAGLLADQMRQTMQHQQATDQLRARIDELMKAPISAAIDLTAGPACIELLQLERLLFLLPEGAYFMNIFTLRIPDIAAIHADLEQQNFHALLSEIADGISEQIGPRHHYVTYAGDGVFGCVVLGHDRANADAGRTNVFRGGITLKAGVPRQTVRLCYAQSTEWQLLSGQGGAEALRSALAKALELKALDRLQRDLDRERLGRDVIVPRRPLLGSLFARDSRSIGRA